VTGPEENQFRPERPERRLGGTETILVVEDQRAVRQLTCTMLRSLGYRVLEAANGGEALLACESHADPIHLMITDFVMPQMSGPDLAAHLRALRPEVRSLYMSGYSEGGGLRRESVEGTADYLQKPFSLEGLADKVREILAAEPIGFPDDLGHEFDAIIAADLLYHDLARPLPALAEASQATQARICAIDAAGGTLGCSDVGLAVPDDTSPRPTIDTARVVQPIQSLESSMSGNASGSCAWRAPGKARRLRDRNTKTWSEIFSSISGRCSSRRCRQRLCWR